MGVLKETANRTTQLYLGVGSIGMICNALATAFLAKSTKPILDKAFVNGNKDALIVSCVTIFIIFVVKGIAEYISNISMEVSGQRITNALQKKYFSRIMGADFHFFQTTHTGDLSSVLINDVRIVKETILTAFHDAVHHSMRAALLIALTLYNNAFLTAMCVWIVPLILFLLKKIGKKIRQRSTISSFQNSDLHTFFHEIFHNIILVKSSNTQKQEIKKIDKKLDSIEKNILSLGKIRAALHPIVEVLGGMAIVGSIMIGGWQVVHGHKTVGSFFSFIVSVLFAYPSLKKLAEVRTKINEGLASYQRLEQTSASALDHYVPRTQKLKKRFDPSNKPIVFDNVSFEYPSQEGYILNNIHCTFNPGMTYALTGCSGSGKTTLFYLLMQLYPTTEGTILWGTDPLDTLCPYALRQHVAFVSQTSQLFEGTIADNIAYGTQASKQAIIHAAHQAFAHDFIVSMPNQYDTVIGSHGIHLSGGQSQRIALARAFLKNAALVLLDESTSALDEESEKNILASIDRLKTDNKIVIAIAHRPSMIDAADCVYTLHNGLITLPAS